MYTHLVVHNGCQWCYNEYNHWNPVRLRLQLVTDQRQARIAQTLAVARGQHSKDITATEE